MIELYALGYVASVIFITGAFIAFFIGKYPSVSDFRSEFWNGLAFAIFASMLWPISVLIVIGLSEGLRYGWYITPRE